MSSMLGEVQSVNVASAPAPTGHRETGLTGIWKVPVDIPVRVEDPGPKGTGGSGLIGDNVVNLRVHGGHDQAVYAYAREDLDWWGRELDRALPGGSFGENLTTRGVDVTGARVGERWRIGDELVLEIACPRLPCTTFAAKMGVPRWIKRFTKHGASGAYLRVIEPGTIRGGDPVRLVSRPDHEVTIGLYFRALTTEAHRLPELLAAGDVLPDETRENIHRRAGADLDTDPDDDEL